MQRIEGVCLRLDQLLVNRLRRQSIKVILLNGRSLLKDGLGLEFRRNQSRTLTRVLLRDVSANSPALVQDKAVVLLQSRCHVMIRISIIMNDIESSRYRELGRMAGTSNTRAIYVDQLRNQWDGIGRGRFSRVGRWRRVWCRWRRRRRRV